MVFGPSRPPITEDVAEVIAKDISAREGNSPPSETPIDFVRHPDPATTVEMNDRVRWILLGLLAAMLVLVAVLLVR